MTRNRRRHNRLVLSLPVKYYLPEKGIEGRALGVLKNISLGGLYFESPPPVAIEIGQILHLSIAADLPSLDLPNTSNLVAKAKVVRLVPPVVPGRACGVAVRFLEELAFSAPLP